MALNPTFSWLASLDPLSVVSVSSYVVFSEWRTLSSASLSQRLFKRPGITVTFF